MAKRKYEKNSNGNLKFDLSEKVNFEFWEERECPICGCHFYARKKYKKITCSDECYSEYVKRHKEEINAKRSESLKRTNFLKPKEKKQQELLKARKTCLDKYGVDMYQKTAEYRSTMSERFKNKDWSDRNRVIASKMLEKYRDICENDNLELLEFRNRFDATVKCKKCGTIFDVHVLGYLTDKANHSLCRHCYPNINSTKNTFPDIFVKAILDENDIDYTKNDRNVLNGYEIDFFISSLSLGIEINGNYWHSEIGGGKGKEYHLSKTKTAFENGVKLIHIFEDEIINKPEIVKSRILNLIGKTPKKIYARNCDIKEISYEEKKRFFEENHIDGDSISKFAVALLCNGEIVSVASFGKRMISKRPSFELIRFASKKYTTVIGGFSKILKYVMSNFGINEITTYADIRWSGIDFTSTTYYKNGFEFVKFTQPNYFYVDRKKYLIRLNRINFQKKKLIKEGFDKNKSESKIMFERGFDRIWDCGSMKFIYKKRAD